MTCEQKTDNLLHFGALDGLRGFAALLVVVSHAANSGYLPDVLGNGLGQMGVTLFFGLSGFLMAYLYCRRPFTLRSFKSYAINRLSRVLPLYYAVAGIAALLFFLADIELFKITNSSDIFRNLLLIEGTSTLWTIPVEIHFYAIFLVIWLAALNRFTNWILLGLLIMQSTLLLPLVLSGEKNDAFIVFWLHIFIFGSFLGLHYDAISRLTARPRYSKVLAMIAWVFVVLAIVAPPEVRREIGIHTFANYRDPITTGYPLAILAFTVFRIGPFSYFDVSVMRWYGKISYSLYLLHMIVIVCVDYFVLSGILASSLGFPVLLMISTAAAWASFSFIERPAQNGIRRIDRRRNLTDSKEASA